VSRIDRELEGRPDKSYIRSRHIVYQRFDVRMTTIK